MSLVMGIGDAIKGLGDMNKLRQQAMTMQKNLSGQVITVDESGVHIEITGDQRILKLEIQGISNEVLNEVLNKAIRKSQELAAQELMKVSGGMM
jgi:DNA-binding protein YbaB